MTKVQELIVDAWIDGYTAGTWYRDYPSIMRIKDDEHHDVVKQSFQEGFKKAKDDTRRSLSERVAARL